ncbi:MAG: polysaccharide pyruvyl transferase family protein [Lachnospiraceae bacterium]|nr:polysaccharide pyruvyl transferase family protein [Lachnospiraceae bacterium]
MKVLHVASFNGNIGDYANHSGFRRCMRHYVNNKIEYTNLEIREFYKSWNMRKFDDDFVSIANQFDLLIFGGGNFFEMCWDYSSTGTTIDIPEEILNKIKCPILFNGLGIDDKNGVINRDNIKKFGRFLKVITSSDQYFVTVRNDGSLKIAEKYFDNSIIQCIHKIPDGGFFVSPKEYIHLEIPDKYKVIGINLAGDAPKVRFSETGSDGRITQEQFIEEFAQYIDTVLSLYNDIFIAFIPHIGKDLELISKVLGKIKDNILRTRISVAPYLNGTITDGNYIFDLYRKCALTIGMRYHSNVCSIAVNTPTIGIVNLPKHKMLYEDIGMQDRLVVSDEPDFGSRLLEKTKRSLSDLSNMKKENRQLLERLTLENEKYFKNINLFLNKNIRHTRGETYEQNSI